MPSACAEDARAATVSRRSACAGPTRTTGADPASWPETSRRATSPARSTRTDPHFRFDAIVAATAEVLRDSPYADRTSLADIRRSPTRGRRTCRATDQVHDFLDLLDADAPHRATKSPEEVPARSRLGRGRAGVRPLRPARRPVARSRGASGSDRARRRRASTGPTSRASALASRTMPSRSPRTPAVVGAGELDDDRAHLGVLGPGRVRDVGRPEDRLAGRDPGPLLADGDPAATLDDDQPGRVRVGVRLDRARRGRRRAR